MATMSGQRQAWERQYAWLLKLIIDYCDEENGQSPCTATESCYFTWETCKDTNNYNKTTRTYQFTNRGAPFVAGALPYLQVKGAFPKIPTEIFPDKFKVEKSECRFRLSEDDALPKADPSKSTSQDDSGRFWRNWLARNPNYHGRSVELYKGYAGVDSANYDLYWSGTIKDLKIGRDGVEIRCLDNLYKAADIKKPNKISDDNLTTDDPLTAGATTVNVTDGTEFQTPSSANEPECIKIESEYITYTGITGNALTGCQRGAYGTTSAEHSVGSKITQALIYSDRDDLGNYQSNMPADWILYDLLCNQAEIDASYMAVSEIKGQTLGVAQGGTTITVSPSYAATMPDSGVIKMDDEFIYYTGKSGNSLTGCKRGMFGTTDAAHSNPTWAYLSAMTLAMNSWHADAGGRAKFEKAHKCAELLKNFQESNLLDIWQNEAGKIDVKIQMLPYTDQTIQTLTQQEIYDHKIDLQEDKRVTRVYVFYGATTADPGEDSDDYGSPYIRIDADAENANNYNESREKSIYSWFIADRGDASWLTQRYLNRYDTACPKVKFQTEIYYDNIETGDYVFLTLPELVDEDGTALTRTYIVTKKDRRGGRLFFEAYDLGHSGSRFGLISPAGTDDYDDASETEKSKYVWISDGDTVGTDEDDEYTIL